MKEESKPGRPAKNAKANDLRFITRMDYARTIGWWVRITISGENVSQKLFSDKAYGGTNQALVAAKEWRDDQLATNAKLRIKTNGWRIHSYDSRNLSGVVGVAPEVERRSKAPYVSAWRATWPGENGQEYCRFSVYDFGYQGAFAKAVAFRYEQIGMQPPAKRAPSERKILAALSAR